MSASGYHSTRLLLGRVHHGPFAPALLEQTRRERLSKTFRWNNHTYVLKHLAALSSFLKLHTDTLWAVGLDITPIISALSIRVLISFHGTKPTTLCGINSSDLWRMCTQSWIAARRRPREHLSHALLFPVTPVNNHAGSTRLSVPELLYSTLKVAKIEGSLPVISATAEAREVQPPQSLTSKPLQVLKDLKLLQRHKIIAGLFLWSWSRWTISRDTLCIYCDLATPLRS